MASPSWKRMGAFAPVLLTGLVFALTRPGVLTSATAVQQHGGPVVPRDHVPNRGPSRFACRASLAGEADQRANLKRHPWFLRRPEMLTPEFLRNPLLADALKIEVENTSGGDSDLYILGQSAFPFRINIRVEDIAGRTVTFPHAGQSGIKSLGPLIGMNDPALSRVTKLRRDQVVTQTYGTWNYLNDQDMPAPGRYRVRVVCSYFRAPDGQEFEVESAPLFVSVTARDVREWRTLYDISNRLQPGEVELPAEPR